jgi:hypothetical protein
MKPWIIYALRRDGVVFYVGRTFVRAKISEKVSATLIGNQRRKGMPQSEDARKRISESLKRLWKEKKNVSKSSI